MVTRLRDFGTLVDNSKEFDRLKLRKDAMEKATPLLGASEAGNGVLIMPNGIVGCQGK